MVEVRAEAAFLIRNSGRQHSDIKTQCTQKGGKQTVGLIAEAAASTLDDLGKQSLILKNNRLFGMNT